MTSNEKKLIEGLINQEEKTRSGLVTRVCAKEVGDGIENGGFPSADDEISRGGMGKGLFQSRGRMPLWLRGFHLREPELQESLVMTYRAG